MSDIKIEDLRIGQTVWYDQECFEIIELSVATGNKSLILENMDNQGVSAYLEEISLTPPRETKRFYRWSVLNDFEGSVKGYTTLPYFLDDEGRTTHGDMANHGGWELMEKIKHENEYIDVEVDW